MRPAGPSAEGQPLKLIGTWRGPADARRWPHPRRLTSIGWWDPALRARIVGYLRAGRTCAAYRGWSSCRFGCGPNGSRELTDGEFAWPEGLAHYVEAHGVRLPEPFLEHARARGFSISSAGVAGPEDGRGAPPEYELAFHTDWCRVEAPPPWTDRLQRRSGDLVRAIAGIFVGARILERGSGREAP